ncbi:MAG: MarR family winged helix-turn-helix transcriptional regulator [Chloroflexota bacterium]|jgi:DNA-binding MarR family transcriptional regulator|nr:MarR family winged helix-turn-helix transcriptional regulator [Chloroflexota bacterium]
MPTDLRESHNPEQCARAWYGLRMAHNAIAGRLESALREACDLSLHEFDAVLHLRLDRDSGVRLQDLQTAVPLSQPALSRLVARLVDRGIVERSPAPDDGRSLNLRLTPAGDDIATRAITVHAETVAAAIANRLDPARQAELLTLLDAIAR